MISLPAYFERIGIIGHPEPMPIKDPAELVLRGEFGLVFDPLRARRVSELNAPPRFRR